MMDLDKARDLAAQLVAALAAPVPTTSPIATPDALDRALSTAVSGAVLTLKASLVYPAPLILRQPVTLQGETVPAGRMTADAPLPRFLGGLTLAGDDVTLRGVEGRHSRPDTDILTFSGARVTLDRVRLLGDPVKGAKRGVNAAGNGACQIVRCYMDDCFQPSPGMDSQAILAYDMAPGLLIDDNFLRAGSETILLGGADSRTLDRMPADVIIRANTITAKPEWQGQPIGVKTRLEVKAGRRVLIEHNIIEHCWVQGQAGFLVSFTVKNQDGAAPWSTIEDVIFRDNDCAHGPAAINILGTDYAHPSGRLARVQIRQNRFTDLNSPLAVQESHKLIQVIEGGDDITIDGNTFVGTFIGSQVYFVGSTKCNRMVLTNNTWPRSLYGILGSDSAFGQAWANHVANGTLSGNVEV